MNDKQSWWQFQSRLRRGLAHAFAIDGERDRLTAGDLELLDRVAHLLAERGLAAPAIFVVESLAPLGFLGSQLVQALTPIMELIVSPEDIERLNRMLEHRETPALFADLLRRVDDTIQPRSGQTRFDQAQRRPFDPTQDRLRPGSGQASRVSGEADCR